MQMLVMSSGKRLALIAEKKFLRVVQSAYLNQSVNITHFPLAQAQVTESELEEKHGRYDAALIIVDSSNYSSKILSGPCLGRLPSALLFANAPQDLADWAESVSSSVQRSKKMWAVISAKQELYQLEAMRMQKSLNTERSRRSVHAWLPDKLTRDELLERLYRGPDLVIYRGHAGRTFLDAYHGLFLEDLTNESSRTCGAVVALACSTLQGLGNCLLYTSPSPRD